MTEELPLNDGSTTLDPRLDRVVQFDERSRNFPIRATLEELGISAPKSKTWGCSRWNDQGREGACVGFSWSHELAADPVVIAAGPEVALRIYKRAQFLDPWPGEAYEGTSVLAGAKAVQELTSLGKQIMPTYRWCFGVDDLILAIGYQGPAVIGVNWYASMFNTDSRGFLRVTGEPAGGHAICVRGINIVWKNARGSKNMANVDRARSYFILRNSWGQDWGKNGDCYLTINDMDRLLKEQGEAVIPVLRRAV